MSNQDPTLAEINIRAERLSRLMMANVFMTLQEAKDRLEVEDRTCTDWAILRSGLVTLDDDGCFHLRVEVRDGH